MLHPQSLNVSLRNSFYIIHGPDFGPKPLDFAPKLSSYIDFSSKCLQMDFFVRIFIFFKSLTVSKVEKRAFRFILLENACPDENGHFRVRDEKAVSLHIF